MNVREPASTEPEEQYLRTLLLIGRPGMLSDSLIFAIEREFPRVSVKQVNSLEQVFTIFEPPVTLILVEASFLRKAQELSLQIHGYHPAAFTAVIEPESRHHRLSFSDISTTNLIRGVLPMNLKLDVWLSVIRLMLRGGEYFPSAMLLAHVQDKAAQRPGVPLQAAGVEETSDLTQREMEVLELVSRGLQNKAIAAELGLSEHTVKIHLHNIISKLHAHNRTGAAAWFRDHQNRKPNSSAPN